MARLNLLLGLVVIISGLWLVKSSHDARQLFVELERAQTESHNLQIEEERLQIDKRAQATLGRVEELAKQRLQMRGHGPEITHLVSSSASASAAGGAR